MRRLSDYIYVVVKQSKSRHLFICNYLICENLSPSIGTYRFEGYFYFPGFRLYRKTNQGLKVRHSINVCMSQSHGDINVYYPDQRYWSATKLFAINDIISYIRGMNVGVKLRVSSK
jgi:hypothetical protein